MKNSILALLLLTTLRSNGQNLVINPSFEDTITYSAWSALFDSGMFFTLPCPPWFEPNLCSTDYLSSVWGGWDATFNPFGYQLARTGIAYMGFCVYYHTPWSVNYRENLTGILSDSLRTNHQYLVSFYVSSAGNLKYYSDDIGAYLSVDSANNYSSNMNLPFTPQVENPQGNFLSDSVNWVLISGYYTATGGEKFITIGNFKDDQSTSVDSFLNNSPLPIAYYYIDDVSVIDCTAAGMHEPEAIQLYLQNPAGHTLLFTTNDKITKARLYNLLGEKVLESHFNQLSSSYLIDVATLPKGMYVLVVESEKGSKGIRKVLKM